MVKPDLSNYGIALTILLVIASVFAAVGVATDAWYVQESEAINSGRRHGLWRVCLKVLGAEGCVAIEPAYTPGIPKQFHHLSLTLHCFCLI